MGSRIKASTEEPISGGKCNHYWIIETALGLTSRGVCKLCGAEKIFDNSLLDQWVDPWAEGDIATLSEQPRLLDIESDGEQDNS